LPVDAGATDRAFGVVVDGEKRSHPSLDANRSMHLMALASAHWSSVGEKSQRSGLSEGNIFMRSSPLGIVARVEKQETRTDIGRLN
jgi:hypothetical protein